MLFFKREARVRNVGYDLANFIIGDWESLTLAYRVEVRNCQLMPWRYLKCYHDRSLPKKYKTFEDALAASKEWVDGV